MRPRVTVLRALTAGLLVAACAVPGPSAPATLVPTTDEVDGAATAAASVPVVAPTARSTAAPATVDLPGQSSPQATTGAPATVNPTGKPAKTTAPAPTCVTVCTATAPPLPSTGPWSIQATPPNPAEPGYPIFLIKVIGTPPPSGGQEIPFLIYCSIDWQVPGDSYVYRNNDMNIVGGEGTRNQYHQSERAIGGTGTFHWWIRCSDPNGTQSTVRSDEGTLTIPEPPATPVPSL